MAGVMLKKRKGKPPQGAWGAVTILNELEDLRLLAEEAASQGDYCTALWMARLSRHLERHGRLSERQLEIAEDARGRYGADLAAEWLR